MDDLISRQDAIDALKICDNNEDGINCSKCPLRDERWDGAWEDDETNCYRKLMRDSAELLSAQPDRGYIEQIKWERDLAIRQLADLGYGLGEKPRANGDLISRQAAIKAICEDGTWLESQGCTEITMAERKQRDADILGELPYAQTDIVRCKDCQHWGIHKRFNIPWCREMHIDRGAEDFCSYAERKEE